MSLVGTRPILQDELQKYELHHRARIAIKPGITGMWQVSGRSDITDFEEVVRLDTEYISSWLIFSKYTNNIILLETQSLLYAYWKKYNYIKNYFLMHIFFRMVTDANPELWEQVPAINHIDSHLLMQELPKHYDENRCQQIMRLTPIHKLTYKGETSSGATAEKLGVLFQNRREQYDSIQ